MSNPSTDHRDTGGQAPPKLDGSTEFHVGRHIANVLVAEDDREMRRLVAEVLRGLGYRVFEVGDGSALLGFLDDSRMGLRPAMDLVIADVRMPGCSGLEVLGALRTVDLVTPVVIMTAFGSDSVHREARRLGAAIVLDKPFSLDELCHAATSVIPPRY